MTVESSGDGSDRVATVKICAPRAPASGDDAVELAPPRTAAAVSADAERYVLPDVDPTWDSNPCAYDIRHFVAMCLEAVRTKDTSAFGMFAHGISMCIFRPMEGERERVLKHLQQTKHSELGFADISKLYSRQYFRKRMRMVCPPPVTMMRDLAALFKIFSRVVNPKKQTRFLKSSWRTILSRELGYVAKGYLSDHRESLFIQFSPNFGRMLRKPCLLPPLASTESTHL